MSMSVDGYTKYNSDTGENVLQCGLLGSSCCGSTTNYKCRSVAVVTSSVNNKTSNAAYKEALVRESLISPPLNVLVRYHDSRGSYVYLSSIHRIPTI